LRFLHSLANLIDTGESNMLGHHLIELPCMACALVNPALAFATSATESIAGRSARDAGS
jgi:hypothetical protein